MRVVIVDGDLAYPATSGKRLRTLHLMLRLARRHQVTYLCRCDERGVEADKAREYFADQNIEAVLIEEPIPRKSGPLFYPRLAVNLLSPSPYTVVAHGNRRIRDWMRCRAAQRDVDLWQFEWPAYADYLRWLPGVRTVINAHNVESLIWQRYHQTETNPLKRWYIKHQWHKYERFERRLFAEATHVAACSDEDAHILRDSLAVATVSVVENGVDCAYFQQARSATRRPKQILFLGALDYRPNASAVNAFLDRVFPRVLAGDPEVRLCIVGRHPGPALARRIRAVPQAELHADVPDVRPFLAQSAVMAVPLQVGGGSRLKILEALATGLPVISTRIGAEGLSFTPGKEIDLIEDVDQMADALIAGLRDMERLQAMAERGRRLVQEQYDWNVLADKLELVWQKCTEPPVPRLSCRAIGDW
jgi:glycosyltransferase involved in cell wall biosynthesis